MPQIAVLLIALLSVAPASAINKCDVNGKLTYTDQPCEGARSLPLDSLPQAASATDIDAARRRAANQKTELERIEATRSAAAAQQQKKREEEREHADKLRVAKNRKCSELALQAKWHNEDAATATGTSADKARRKAARHAEKVRIECGK